MFSSNILARIISTREKVSDTRTGETHCGGILPEESTKIELEILYPLLSKGGVLIIDDYGAWQGAKKAVDEYFKDTVVWMHYIDHDCRLIIK